MLKIECKNCNKIFFAFPSLKRKFCSLSCLNKWRSISENNVMFGKRAWSHGQTKYTNSIIMQVSNTNTGMIKKRKRKREVRKCINCGTEFETILDKRAKRFCSLKCSTHGENNGMYGKPRHFKSSYFKGGFRKDLGHYTRSAWEANYARLLKYLGVDYEYEPERFYFENMTYLPDFKVESIYIELKGSLIEECKKRMIAFRKAYPDKSLIMIDANHYRRLSKVYRSRVQNWEGRP